MPARLFYLAAPGLSTPYSHLKIPYTFLGNCGAKTLIGAAFFTQPYQTESKNLQITLLLARFREFAFRDGFAPDCVAHQTVQQNCPWKGKGRMRYRGLAGNCRSVLATNARSSIFQG